MMEVSNLTSNSSACDGCREMFSIFTARLAKEGSESPPYLTISVAWDTMLDCAQRGCRFCLETSRLASSWWSGIQLGRIELSLGIPPPKHEPYIHLRASDAGGLYLSKVTIFLCVLAETDTPAAAYYHRRPPPTNLSNESIVHEAKQRLQTCLAEHKTGPQRPGDPFLPLRVIDVDKIRLHRHQGGQRSTYAALSYCWGRSQSYVTTTANFESHLKSLDLNSMPKTIRDAIATTKALGIPYLWVDALCIKQDSSEDKAIQINGMNKIYKDATVTIVAANAPGAHKGFLAALPYLQSIEVRFPFPGGRLSTVWLAEMNEYHEDELGPLYQRAWAFQERILSPRLLIYGQKELIWQCHQDHNVAVLQSNMVLRSLPRTTRLPMKIYDAKLQQIVGPELDFDLPLWQRIVQEYSQCDMTLPEDKLPALAGIAKELQNIWRLEYLAGLWNVQLVRQLCWHLDSPPKETEPGQPPERAQMKPLGTSKVYRAPSWSWAAVDGQILHWSPDGDPRFRHDLREDASVVKCSVQPVSRHAAFGQLRSGTLVIEGNLIKIQDFEVEDFYLTSMDTNGLPIQSFLCDPENQRKIIQDKLWILVLMTPRTYDLENYHFGPTFQGLFLEGLDSKRFRRIGYWEMSGKGSIRIMPKESPESGGLKYERRIVTLI